MRRSTRWLLPSLPLSGLLLIPHAAPASSAEPAPAPAEPLELWRP